jgi:hypothetical protein
MNHQMTLETSGTVITLRCSCGAAVFRSARRSIPWDEISVPAAAHLQPEIDEMLRKVLRQISVKDIIREILRRRS